MMKLDERRKCKTVGELKRLLEDVPDDWDIVIIDDEGDGIYVSEINSFWHGALTLE